MSQTAHLNQVDLVALVALVTAVGEDPDNAQTVWRAMESAKGARA